MTIKKIKIASFVQLYLKSSSSARKNYKNNTDLFCTYYMFTRQVYVLSYMYRGTYDYSSGFPP